jgi:hypothetical protein
VNETVQVRPAGAVVHSVDVAEMSAIAGVPPFTAIATDEADGETNAGCRDPADVARDGIRRIALPCERALPAAGAVLGAVPPPHALRHNETSAIAVPAIGRCMGRGCDLEFERPAVGSNA